MSQDGANAELISHMLMEMGNNVSESIKFAAQRRLAQKDMDLKSLQKVKDFMSLPPDKRRALLLDPNFRQDMIKTLDPEAFATARKTKKTLADTQGMSTRDASVTSLGTATPDEMLAQQTAAANSQKAQAEAGLAAQKLRISTGVEKPTPLSLLMSGDVKDPIAAATFSLIPQDDLKQMALAAGKMGPLYQSQQMQDWYKWGTDQGFSPGLAMNTAVAISKGEWDKVPTTYQDPKTLQQIPVRGKAEQQLALDTLQAQSKRLEVQNTIESSIATTASDAAAKWGIPLDQARANVVALREGKPTPFATPHLQEMATLDELNKKTEVEKNIQTVLNDKSGIGMIKDSLNSMISLYKEQGTFGGSLSSAQTKDLEDKINKTRESLASALSARYGIQYDSYDKLHGYPMVSGAMSAVWGGMKATGAAGLDLSEDAFKGLDDYMNFSGHYLQPKPDTFIPGGTITGPKTAPNANRGKFTPEQETIFRGLHQNVQTALADPNTTQEQKNQLRDYVDQKLDPVYNDPSRFNELLLTPQLQPAGSSAGPGGD